MMRFSLSAQSLTSLSNCSKALIVFHAAVVCFSTAFFSSASSSAIWTRDWLNDGEEGEGRRGKGREGRGGEGREVSTVLMFFYLLGYW